MRVQRHSERHRRHHFSFSWLANTVTLFNLFSGFLAILMASEGHLDRASWMILVALFWDSLDGNIARTFKNPTLFGRELDSLADVVSFVAAPAFIALKSWDYRLSPWTLLVVFFYLGAGAYRLARFNIKPPVKSSFEGLPTPAAAVTLSMTVLAYLKNGWSDITVFTFVQVLLMALMSFLMVSHVGYPKISAAKFSRWSPLFYLELAAFGGGMFLMNFETALAAAFLIFIFLAPAYGSSQAQTEAEGDEELAAKPLK